MEGKTHDTPCINQQFAFASLSHTCFKVKATSLSRDHALFTHCVHGIYYQGSNESPFFSHMKLQKAIKLHFSVRRRLACARPSSVGAL